MSTSPLHLHRSPSAGFDEPFEMLLACHERVQRMNALLLRLARHLPEHGADADARQAAADVLRYFDQAGPAHHEDEERHLFPALLARGDAAAVAVVQRLQADHLAMHARWQQVRADLQAVAQGRWPPAEPQAVLLRWQAHADHYAAHIELEDHQAYPAAQALLDAPAQTAMGQEMAQRRGVPAPRPAV